jgi:hypothetical protein
MSEELTDDFILDLLKEPVTLYHVPPVQTSKFVRWMDKEMRCANRGCGSPTYIKVVGIPRCKTHAIHLLARMLDDGVINGSIDNRTHESTSSTSESIDEVSGPSYPRQPKTLNL